MRIEKNDQVVTLLAASATGKDVDNEGIRKVNEFAADLTKDFSPENRYHMAELVRFAVETGLTERLGYLDFIADYKNLGDNDQALFDMEYDNSYAVIQADNATVPAWSNGGKTVTLSTVEVASSFRVNMYDLRSGKADIGKMTAKAIARMEGSMTARILEILNASYDGTVIKTPFYGTGSGIVAATLDPMIRHFQRLGAVNLVGDIAIMDKLSQAQGWVSDEMRNEYYQTGRLGKYKGSLAVQMNNEYKQDGTTTVLPTNKLFIIPNGTISPLKVAKKGSMLSMEAQDIDTAFYEIVLRQRFGAAVIFAQTPMLGVYNDAA